MQDDPTVEIDGVDFPLSAFPEAQLDMLEFECIDEPAERGEQLELLGYSPTDCVQSIAYEHDRDTVVVDGLRAQVYIIGAVYEGAIGFRPNGEFSSCAWREVEEDSYELDDDWRGRMFWLSDKRGYTIWWHRDDTGDGILLDATIYKVAFHDADLEAQFAARFPEARA